jgi:rod shape-determining protein MreC
MRNLIQLIFRYHVFLLFLLLQVVAFALLFYNNRYHQTAYLSSANELVGDLYSKRNAVEDYMKLSEINDELALENALLKSRQRRAFYDLNENLILSENDSLFRQQFVYTSAKVVNSSVSKRQNYITIDKGRNHDIAPEMGVVANNSLVGVVKDVSDHYAVVMPMVNTNFRVSVKLKKSGEFGQARWTGNDPGVAEVDDIPKHAKIEVGDTIVTTGYSTFFPENVTVGTVRTKVINEGENFYSLTINLSTDFSSLSYVDVIINLLKEERENLEERVNDAG